MSPFSDEAILLVQPALDYIGTVLVFPLLQRLVIAAFGFNHFTGVRVLVDLEIARLALASCRHRRWSALRALWVQQVDDVLEAETVLIQHLAQLGLELDLFFQRSVALHRFQCLELLGEVFFQLTVFGKFGHACFLCLFDDCLNASPAHKFSAILKVSDILGCL